MTENASPPETTHEGNPLRQTLELYQDTITAIEGQKTMVSIHQMALTLHQENWQKKLLAEYGNTMALLDATYKITSCFVLHVCQCTK